MELVLVMALVALVVALVVAPLRPGRGADRGRADNAERERLEAERDAKYREIRDAELDFRTGKLSEGQWRAQDRALKREAVELLRRLDAVAEPSEADRPAPAPDGGA